MNTKLMISFIVLLLILPAILAQVKVQLGEPYVNIKDFSKIKFTTHSSYYEICSFDKTTIPVLINNKNNFSDTFNFEVDKEYASLPVKRGVIKSGKSAILPLTISPPIDLEDNTTLILNIITKKEGLKRSVIIKTNIQRCYLFDLEIDTDKDEICGCDTELYTITLINEGMYADSFILDLDAPEWVNSTLENESIQLDEGQKKEIILEANPSCEEKGSFTVSAGAVSEKTKLMLMDKLELTVLPQNECYNTIITANNAAIDYFGKNIPITIRNKGVKDATYSLSVEGIDWYKLSQTDFNIKKNNEKTINLALYPDKSVVEGNYNIDIRAKTGEQEFTKSITIKLRSKGTVFEKIRFYLNYFRYYIGAGIVLLVIILLLMVLVKRRARKEDKEQKIKESEEKPKERDEKEIKKAEKKVEEKKIAKKVEKTKKERGWLLPLISYLIFLAFLILLAYSTFKYKPYYEKALNFISGLFEGYAIPYAFYLRYLIIGIGAAIIIILIIDFFRKRPEKKAVKKKEERRIEKEELKEEKAVKLEKVSKKIVGKRKLRLYPILVILLLLAIAVYSWYRFSDKLNLSDKIKFITNFVKGYYLYFIIGIIILVLLIAIINFVKKAKGKSRKTAREKKVVKKLKRKTKKLIMNFAIILVGLIVLSGIIYSFVYYNLMSYITDFFIVYYPYILMGAGILIILILILHFHSKNIS